MLGSLILKLIIRLEDNVVRVKEGLCTIFSNERFSDERRYTRRIGTDKDVEALTNVFRWLNFEVRSHLDLTCVEMVTELRKYRNDDYHGYDAFFCFFLSHGENEAIISTDGKEIKLDTIRDIFLQSKGLRRTPKFVFIQACRGSDNVELVPAEYITSKPLGDNTEWQKEFKAATQSTMEAANTKSTDRDIEVEEQGARGIMPRDVDFMMLMASTSGTYSS